MITINFIKLFPKSCKEKGISDLFVNFNEIKQFKRTIKPKVGFGGQEFIEDFIQVGNDVYRFSSNDNGIGVLGGISTAINIIQLFEKTKSSLLELENECFEKQYKAALTSLSRYALKYG